jgi:hypothetical protein
LDREFRELVRELKEGVGRKEVEKLNDVGNYRSDQKGNGLQDWKVRVNEEVSDRV